MIVTMHDNSSYMHTVTDMCDTVCKHVHFTVHVCDSLTCACEMCWKFSRAAEVRLLLSTKVRNFNTTKCGKYVLWHLKNHCAKKNVTYSGLSRSWSLSSAGTWLSGFLFDILPEVRFASKSCGREAIQRIQQPAIRIQLSADRLFMPCG